MNFSLQLRFYEELNDFLPQKKRKVTYTLDSRTGQSIKDLIECEGVPHTEVDLILVNGESVGFDYQAQPGDRIAIYPVFEQFDISPIIRLRPKPLRELRFVIDVNLGKLARLMRMLGFDCLYRNDFADREVVDISVSERRVILTRDLGILKYKAVTHGYFVRSDHPETQLCEVIRRLDLVRQINPFCRCMVCNGLLHKVEKQTVETRIPPLTAAVYRHFFQCRDCGKIYWKGTHYEQMLKFIERIRRT